MVVVIGTEKRLRFVYKPKFQKKNNIGNKYVHGIWVCDKNHSRDYSRTKFKITFSKLSSVLQSPTTTWISLS